MNVDRMRFVDQGIGIPLCWFFTQWSKLTRLWKKDHSFKSPSRILFLKPAEMGTSVILYPTIAKTKEMYPEAELFFVAFEENVAIFDVLDVIPKENILTLRTQSFFTLVLDTWNTILKLRRLKIDMVMDFEFFSRYTALFSYFTGASYRSGFHRFHSEGLYRGELMTHRVPYNYYLHVGQSFMTLLYAFKYPPGKIALQENVPIHISDIPKLHITTEAKQNLINKLRLKNPAVSFDTSKFVVVSPNTGEWLPYRKWPIEYYTELVQKLIQNHEDVYVLISGSCSAIADGIYIEKHVNHPRLINLVSQTSFREFIDLLSISKVVVSVDSGPAHFACLTNIGIVCIFGPDTQEIFAPLSQRSVSIESGLACHPCFSAFNARRPNCDDRDKPCLRSIAVERIYHEVERFLT